MELKSFTSRICIPLTFAALSIHPPIVFATSDGVEALPVDSNGEVLPVQVISQEPRFVYTGFMSEVIAQNGGFSNEPHYPCHEEDNLCVSGLLDMDLRYYDRRGNSGQNLFNIQNAAFASSQVGVGIRPHFGPSSRTVIGSFNNANLFMDAKIPPYATIHANLAYVNASATVDAYQFYYAADWGSVYRPAAALKVDELYFAVANPDVLPIYFKAGRMYSDFGDYIPNAYGINTIVPSLTQLLTQYRTGGGQIGLVLPNGFYGSLTMSYGQQSIDQRDEPQFGAGSLKPSPNGRNWSGKLGFRNTLYGIDSNLNISLISDLRDVDYLNDTVQWLALVDPNTVNTGSFVYTMVKQAGFAYHADFYLCPFGLSFEGMHAFGKMNPETFIPSGYWDSQIYTGGVEGRVDFKTLGHDSNFKVSYQWAGHTQVIERAAANVRTRVHNVLPRYRWQGTYVFNIIDHFNLGLSWVRDHDFDRLHNGIDVGSNMIVARLDMEV